METETKIHDDVRAAAKLLHVPPEVVDRYVKQWRIDNAMKSIDQLSIVLHGRRYYKPKE